MFTPDRYPADVSAGGPNASNLRQPETPALAPSVPSAEPAIASPPKEPASKSRMRLQLRNSMRLIDSLWHRHFEQLTRLDTQADSKHLQTEVQSLVEHLAFCTKHSDELDHVLLLQSAPTYVSVLEVWNRACRQGVWLTTLNPALVSCLRLLVVWAERIPAFYQKHSTRLKWRVSRIYQTFGRALIAAGQVVDNALQEPTDKLLAIEYTAVERTAVPLALLLLCQTLPFAPYVAPSALLFSTDLQSEQQSGGGGQSSSQVPAATGPDPTVSDDTASLGSGASVRTQTAQLMKDRIWKLLLTALKSRVVLLILQPENVMVFTQIIHCLGNLLSDAAVDRMRVVSRHVLTLWTYSLPLYKLKRGEDKKIRFGLSLTHMIAVKQFFQMVTSEVVSKKNTPAAPPGHNSAANQFPTSSASTLPPNQIFDKVNFLTQIGQDCLMDFHVHTQEMIESKSADWSVSALCCTAVPLYALMGIMDVLSLESEKHVHDTGFPLPFMIEQFNEILEQTFKSIVPTVVETLQIKKFVWVVALVPAVLSQPNPENYYVLLAMTCVHGAKFLAGTSNVDAAIRLICHLLLSCLDTPQLLDSITPYLTKETANHKQNMQILSARQAAKIAATKNKLIVQWIRSMLFKSVPVIARAMAIMFASPFISLQLRQEAIRCIHAHCKYVHVSWRWFHARMNDLPSAASVATGIPRTQSRKSLTKTQGRIKMKFYLAKVHQVMYLSMTMLMSRAILVVETLDAQTRNVFRAYMLDTLAYLEFCKVDFSQGRALTNTLLRLGKGENVDIKFKRAAATVEGAPAAETKKATLIKVVQGDKRLVNVFLNSLLHGHETPADIKCVTKRPRFKPTYQAFNMFDVESLDYDERTTSMATAAWPRLSVLDVRNPDLAQHDPMVLNRTFFLLKVFQQWTADITSNFICTKALPLSYRYLLFQIPKVSARAHKSTMACINILYSRSISVLESEAVKERNDSRRQAFQRAWGPLASPMLWVQNTFSTEQRLVQPPQQSVLLSTDTQEVMDVKNAKIFAGYARHVCWDYADLAIQAYPETVSFQSLSGMYVGLLSTFHKEDVFLLHATQRLVDRMSVLVGRHCAVNGRPKISSYESQKKRHEIPPELKSKTTKPGGSSVESVGGAKPLLLLSLQLVQLLDVRFLTPILESLSAAFRAAHGPSKHTVQHALAATTLRVLMHNFDLYRRDEAVEWYHALFSDGDFANLELAPEQVLRLEGLSKPRAKL